MPDYGYIEEVHSSECPVSAITQKSFDLVQIVNGIGLVNKAAGSVMEADLPGYLLDAIKICHLANGAADEAEREAAKQR